MSQREKPRRRYRSALREGRAAQTRADIVAAARALFEVHGFAGTTIAAIAAGAGVSPQTIYATFGSKARVAGAIVEQMEKSADVAATRRRIATAREPSETLRAFAEWTCAFFAASMPHLVGAGDLTAEMQELAAEGDARRRRGLADLVGRLAGMGAIRSDLTEAEAVDRAWLVTGLDTYRNATKGCGWSPEEFVTWLTETLEQQLLEPVRPCSA